MSARADVSEEVLAPPHLDCIHCGICLSSCPTYLQNGGEADSPRGRIYLIEAMKKGRVAAGPVFRLHMARCLECRACETACPSGVRFSAMINEARIEIRRQRIVSGGESFLHRFLFRIVFPSPALLHIGFRALRLYQRSGLRRLVRASGLLRAISGRISRLEAMLPEIPRAARYELRGVNPLVRRARVSLFKGCIMPELFGPVHEATVRVLEHNGVAVGVAERQTCCGALHLHDGDMETARALARRNIAAFEGDGAEGILVNAAGCGAMLKEYGELLAGDPAYAARARAFSRRVYDICEFLDALGILRDMDPVECRAAYDDPCHLLHGQGIRDAPRNLLRGIPGLELVDLRDADRCCGSAGVYNITQPEMSERILDEKIADIVRSGAEVVASGNPGCLIQIEAGLRARNLPVEVVHPIELLDFAYTPKTARSGACVGNRTGRGVRYG